MTTPWLKKRPNVGDWLVFVDEDKMRRSGAPNLGPHKLLRDDGVAPALRVQFYDNDRNAVGESWCHEEYLRYESLVEKNQRVTREQNGGWQARRDANLRSVFAPEPRKKVEPPKKADDSKTAGFDEVDWIFLED
jgi:hypothetical protein